MLETYYPDIVCSDLDDSDHEQSDTRCCQVKCNRLFCRMEVFSMIKNSIVSEDTNPIYNHFEIGRQVGSCGPEMIWKIYEAFRIEDKKEASVFIFDKKIADKLHKPRRRETVSEILRRDVQLLGNIRHPRILTVIHPLEECHNSLAFASEPVLASLANLLGNCDRLQLPVPQEIKDYEFLEYEVQYGILQITEALSYLHGTEQLIHRNICPQTVLITKRGNWKISGLGFAERVKDGKESCSCSAWSNKAPKMAQPDLNYIAPEIQTSKTCNYVSDMFSLGMVICTIYNEGTPVMEAEYSTSMYFKQLDLLSQKFGDVAHKMPLQIVEPVEKMINKDIRYRPTAQLFSLLKIFHDTVVSTLQQLDSMDMKDPVQRMDVYAMVAQNIPNIPKTCRQMTITLIDIFALFYLSVRLSGIMISYDTVMTTKKILYRHVFPVLCLECSAPETVTSALFPLLTLIDYATREEYIDVILPEFRFIMNSPKPAQATAYILNKLDIILIKSPSEEIRSEVLPLVFNSLESNSLQAQEAALNAIGIIKEYLDDGVMRSMVLPRAKALFHKSDNVRARVNSLTCIDHLLDSLNKMIILDEVLPFLIDITSCQDPSIVMAVVGLYKHMLSDKKFGLTHNLIATRVMPPLIPHTVNPGLSMEQFGDLMEVLREMMSQIDRRRRDKMKQETVVVPVPQRGSINMPTVESKAKDEKCSPARNLLSVQDAMPSGMQKSRTEQSFTSLLARSVSRHKDLASSPRKAPNSPDIHHNKEEKLVLDKPQESPRRFSLVPPGSGGTPGISLISDESPCTDRPRRPSTQSLGGYNFPVSWFTEFRRGSSDSSRRSSTDKPRRPSTHSVGILPISMFGEGGEKPRKPSTHSLGILPLGYDDDHNGFDRHRRPSAGPFITPDFDHKGSRGSLFGGFGEGKGGQRRASFQALGETVMQLFSGK